MVYKKWFEFRFDRSEFNKWPGVLHGKCFLVFHADLINEMNNSSDLRL